MTHEAHSENDEVQIIGGMIASETPQQRAELVIRMLERGEHEQVRALAAARAAKTVAAFAQELACLDAE